VAKKVNGSRYDDWRVGAGAWGDSGTNPSVSLYSSAGGSYREHHYQTYSRLYYDDLADAEQRIGHSLPPLHWYVLTLSNGGTLPYVNSMDYFAAAVPREREWNVLQLPPGVDDINDDPGLLPQKPLLLGKPFAETLLSVGIDPARFRVPDFDPAHFIVMACGFFDADGFYCYHRDDFGPIYAVGQPQYGVYVVAPDFETFSSDQWLIFDADEELMISRIRALL